MQAEHKKQSKSRNGAKAGPGPDSMQSNGNDSKPTAPNFRPALFSACSDLSSLRYDFPLVLGRTGEETVVRSLSAVIDEALRNVAPRGVEGESLRSHVFRLEGGIRALVAGGARTSLGKAWDLVESQLPAASDEAERQAISAHLSGARKAIPLDGTLIDCDADGAVEIITHLWRGAETRKARAFFRQIDRLIYRLENMLRADVMHSPESWRADTLKHSMGGAFAEAFDFAALGGAIQSVSCKSGLPKKRRKRVEEVLSILKSSKLFRRGDTTFDHLVFDNCADAVEVYEEHLEDIATLVKAVGTAELELANRYREGVHDAAFAAINTASLKREQISPFPCPLVLLRNGGDPPNLGGILESLASGFPVKIAVISHDIAGGSEIRSDLASMALGLNDVFVVQAAGSHIGRAGRILTRGLATDGPALFSIYSGAGPGSSPLPPYLVAAAAVESRMYPNFWRDPTAGETWADRFDLAENPSPANRWTVNAFAYEDGIHQRHSENVAFTPVDFACCNRAWDDSFQDFAPGAWKEDMIPAAEYLELSREERAGRRPYVLAIDEDNRLWRRVPDENLIALAARRSGKWRCLQELAGFGNSHAARLLEKERACWVEEKEAELQRIRAEAATAPPVPAEASPEAAAGPAVDGSAAESASEGAKAAPGDEPFIETPRCTSCDECIKINNRMFAYNENKQAYIADPDAGPYADLVAAAENCQVSIIHPGRPRNPDEPDLGALRKRAEPFL